jgi:hypothetical protein
LCFSCSKNVTGKFSAANFLPAGGLGYQFLSALPPTVYNESNRIAYANSIPITISGTINKDFNLPITTTNCNGTIELVLTAIIYYEDCSICYVSKAFDKNFNFHFLVPWEEGTISKKKYDYVGHVTLMK